MEKPVTQQIPSTYQATPPAPPQGQVIQPPPQQQAGSSVVVVTQAAPNFGPEPFQMTCGNCHAQIVTDIRYQLGLCSYLSAGIMFIFGCWPFCLIPLCIHDCSDVHHQCPHCNMELGTYRRI